MQIDKVEKRVKMSEHSLKMLVWRSLSEHKNVARVVFESDCYEETSSLVLSFFNRFADIESEAIVAFESIEQKTKSLDKRILLAKASCKKKKILNVVLAMIKKEAYEDLVWQAIKPKR